MMSQHANNSHNLPLKPNDRCNPPRDGNNLAALEMTHLLQSDQPHKQTVRVESLRTYPMILNMIFELNSGCNSNFLTEFLRGYNLQDTQQMELGSLNTKQAVGLQFKTNSVPVTQSTHTLPGPPTYSAPAPQPFLSPGRPLNQIFIFMASNKIFKFQGLFSSLQKAANI